MSITTKTADLTAGEIKKVSFDKKYPYIYVKNLSDNGISVSEQSTFTAYADNVTAIPAHSTGLIYRNAELQDVYILAVSAGKAEILGAYDANLSFNYPNSIEGGGSSYDDTEIKNEIADLQNSKVDKVSGKGLSTNDYTTEDKEKLAELENYDDTAIKSDIANKVDNDIFVAENLIHYPYNNDTATSGGITFTDNEDGSIAVTGSVTKANTNYNYKLNPNEYTKLEIGQTYILNNCGDLDDDCYLRLFYKADNGTETYLASTKNGSYTFVATETINEVRIWITVNCDDTTKEFNNVIKPMLEIGSVAHAYQPYKLSRKAVRDDIDAILALSLEV